MEVVDFNSLTWHDAIIHKVIINKMGTLNNNQIRFVIEWPLEDYTEDGPIDEEIDEGDERSFNTIVFKELIDLKIDLPCNMICVESLVWASCEEITRESPDSEYYFRYESSSLNGKTPLDYSSEIVYKYTFRSYGTITIVAKGFYLE